MTVESFIICVVMGVVTLAVLAAPFWRGSRVSAAQMTYQRQRDTLLVYYQQATASLRDLDDDLQAGRLSEPDYAADRECWMQRGVQILRALDELDRSNPALATATHAPTDAVEQNIEDAVRRYIDEQNGLKTPTQG